jgi:hypothetical protein
VLFIVRFHDRPDRLETRKRLLSQHIIGGLRERYEILHWSKAFEDRQVRI